MAECEQISSKGWWQVSNTRREFMWCEVYANWSINVALIPSIAEVSWPCNLNAASMTDTSVAVVSSLKVRRTRTHMRKRLVRQIRSFPGLCPPAVRKKKVKTMGIYPVNAHQSLTTIPAPMRSEPRLTVPACDFVSFYFLQNGKNKSDPALWSDEHIGEVEGAKLTTRGTWSKLLSSSWAWMVVLGCTNAPWLESAQ